MCDRDVLCFCQKLEVWGKLTSPLLYVISVENVVLDNSDYENLVAFGCPTSCCQK